MKQSSQFSVSVHILTLLYFAQQRGECLSSDRIAGSVNTNPVVIRKIIVKLKKAGFVDTVKGTGGGSVLCVAAEALSLWDIYKAVESTRIINSSYTDPNPECRIGRRIQSFLEDVYEDVDSAVEKSLSGKKLIDITSKY